MSLLRLLVLSRTLPSRILPSVLKRLVSRGLFASLLFTGLLLCCMGAIVGNANAQENLPAVLGSTKPNATIVFLGDSNTYSGQWIDYLDAWQMKQYPDRKLKLLNLGLSSETASGLSEPSHPFPRPDVRTRIDSVLAKTQPDVVFVCYGMNDGIYHPKDESRFRTYQRGIREVIEKIRAVGATPILITPPAFDALPLREKGKLRGLDAKSFSWEVVSDEYDQVIEQYASWIVSQRDLAPHIIDIHTPMKLEIGKRRMENPKFTFAGDGIHYDSEGHRLVAETVLRALGHSPVSLQFDTSYLQQISKRQRLLRDAYLTHCGHSRPGIPTGKPLAEAWTEANAIEVKIRN